MNVLRLLAMRLAGGLALVTLVAVPALGQSTTDVPRTPWGVPDLGGVWDYRTITPLERPEEYGDRAFLTDEEVAELEREAEDRERVADEAPARLTEVAEEGANLVSVVGCCNRFWLDYGTQAQATGRTSLIIDPPNGRLPAMTPEAEARPPRRSSFGTHAFNSMEDFSPSDRCTATLGVPIRPIPYNNNIQLFQTEEHLVMFVEMMKTMRIIPISERPHSAVRQDAGSSSAHWENDVLVVETTNFADGPSVGGASAEATLIERFRRVSSEILEYEYTVDDPATWTAPWSALQTLRSNPLPIFEYACHEGNYGMTNMLRGARLEEARAAEQDAR